MQKNGSGNNSTPSRRYPSKTDPAIRVKWSALSRLMLCLSDSKLHAAVFAACTRADGEPRLSHAGLGGRPSSYCCAAHLERRLRAQRNRWACRCGEEA